LIGLGTWQGSKTISDANHLRNTITHALKIGYRLIDTATLYGCEDIVGEAVRASGVPREEITIVTKFWSEWHHDPGASLERSLQVSGLDYFDIFLMHWPCALTPDGQHPLTIEESPTFLETWKAMEKLVGPKCRGIGVSNFTVKTLEPLLKEASIIPIVNQVELHAGNPNLRLVPWCQDRGIQVMAWSPLGGQYKDQTNWIRTASTITEIAETHNCSPSVVSLSWEVQRGIITIPKSGSPERLEENLRTLVTLSDAEMEKMNGVHVTIGKFRLADNLKAMQYMVPGKGVTTLGWTKVDFGFEDTEGNWLC